MSEPLYEIVETRYSPKEKTSLEEKGTLEQMKARADELAWHNIGNRYSGFREGSYVAEHQSYYSTTVTCPKCGEVIPLE